MSNWTDGNAPRFVRPPSGAGKRAGTVLRVATFNLQLSARLMRVLDVVRSTPALAAADLLALQEADEDAVERLADLLGAGYIYYPAARHPRTGRNFGPAIITHWPIRDDRKLILPHSGLHGMHRIAVGATLEVRGRTLEAWAVHFGTMREVLPWHQAAQARAVLAAVAPGGTAVVAGDLNRKGIGRLFEEVGWQWPTRNVGPTHHVWSFDHVLVRGFEAAPSRAGAVRAALRASDHRAVWVDLPLPGSEDPLAS